MKKRHQQPIDFSTPLEQLIERLAADALAEIRQKRETATRRIGQLTSMRYYFYLLSQESQWNPKP